MTIAMKRQITDDEKTEILQKYGRKCFATGHEIVDGETVQFDHIHAFNLGGGSYLDNIAPMCEEHNKRKGSLPLADFRTKLKLEQFFKKGDRLTLRDFLEFLKEEKSLDNFGRAVSLTHSDDGLLLECDGDSTHFTLYECSITKSTYFYGPINVSWLDSDDDEDENIGLQPRYLIIDKVFNLYRHFVKHPVMQPSIGRIVNGNRIRLFDGQHKVAALLLAGERSFDCKIYVKHDVRLLNQTNIAAHDKYAQTRFFSSVMVLKLGSQFGGDFEEYKNREDGESKSEAGFMKFLMNKSGQTMTNADLNKRFRSYLFNSVLNHEGNLLSELVSPTNRSTADKPLTIDMLSKSIFACFLYRHPVEDDMASPSYKREHEIDNVADLMNMLHQAGLASWNSKVGVNDEGQRSLLRLYRSKSIMAWTELVRDAIFGKLEIVDAEERERPFYRKLSDDDRARIRGVIDRLYSWPMWSSPLDSEIDRTLADKKSAVKRWLKDKGLTTGYLMGAPE